MKKELEERMNELEKRRKNWEEEERKKNWKNEEGIATMKKERKEERIGRIKREKIIGRKKELGEIKREVMEKWERETEKGGGREKWILLDCLIAEITAYFSRCQCLSS